MTDARPRGRDVSEADLARFWSGLRRAPVVQGRSEGLLRALMRAWCWAVGWRLEVGPVALPAATTEAPGSGCLIVVAPHRSWVEPFLLLASWPPDAARLVWLADGRTATRSWWRRRLLPHLGVLPIETSAGAPRRYADLVAEVLAAGVALAVFPEKGPPSTPGRTRAISPGFAYLARRAGAPVVPVVIGGTHAVMRGSYFGVRFLDAIEADEADADPFTREARPLAHALAERYAVAVDAELPGLDARADARRPSRQRWRWLATLFD